MSITDEIIGVSQLFGACAQAAPHSLHLRYQPISRLLSRVVPTSKKTAQILIRPNTSSPAINFKLISSFTLSQVDYGLLALYDSIYLTSQGVRDFLLGDTQADH